MKIWCWYLKPLLSNWKLTKTYHSLYTTRGIFCTSGLLKYTLYRVINEFWSNLNFSRVVWDINTKFSQVNVLISFQLFTNFDITSYIQNGFPAKTILSFSRAWQAYFLSHSHQTPQIFYFFADLQIILLSFLGISNCFKNTKNAGAFLSRYSDLLGQG